MAAPKMEMQTLRQDSTGAPDDAPYARYTVRKQSPGLAGDARPNTVKAVCLEPGRVTNRPNKKDTGLDV